MKKIEIYDTSLRDGAQMQGIAFSVNDKLKILEILDDLGIAYVEGGWPGANPKDVDFYKEAQKFSYKNTILTAFGSTKKAKTKVAEDQILQALLRAQTKVVCIVSKSSANQIQNTMQIDLEENLDMLAESITYLKSAGREVFVDAEHFFDGYFADKEYLHKFVQRAIEAGASRMILCDTNGGSLPEYVYNISKEFVDQYGSAIGFGIHAHNDSELAVANSIRAVKAGVIQVQGTVNGYGERCGNANLMSIIPNLQLKVRDDQIICIAPEKLVKLSSVAKKIAEIANMNLNQSQPFVGARAFTHKGGLHASAISKDKTSYEHIDPNLVGNSTRIVISDQSGLSNILDWLKNNNFVLGGDVKQAAQVILQMLKDKEHQGFSYENANASFEIVLRKILQDQFQVKEAPKLKQTGTLMPCYFELIESNVHIVNGEKTEATVRIKIKDQEKHSVSLGNGPANALDFALRKALIEYYPEIENFVLQDFKVRILDSHLGTGAITKVQINTGTRNGRSWDTMGLSSNIIKASWDAIVDSLVFGLIDQGVPCTKL